MIITIKIIINLQKDDLYAKPFFLLINAIQLSQLSCFTNISILTTKKTTNISYITNAINIQ